MFYRYKHYMSISHMAIFVYMAMGQLYVCIFSACTLYIHLFVFPGIYIYIYIYPGIWLRAD